MQVAGLFLYIIIFTCSYLMYEREQSSGTDVNSRLRFQSTQVQRYETLAETALSELSAVTDQEGVWDMFIACQVQLLEYFR